MLTAAEFNEVIGRLISTARTLPGRQVPIFGPQGEQVATFVAHDLPARPQDMPRHLRPKIRLSKRQRDAAKRKKRAAAGSLQYVDEVLTNAGKQSAP